MKRTSAAISFRMLVLSERSERQRDLTPAARRRRKVGERGRKHIFSGDTSEKTKLKPAQQRYCFSSSRLPKE